MKHIITWNWCIFVNHTPVQDCLYASISCSFIFYHHCRRSDGIFLEFSMWEPDARAHSLIDPLEATPDEPHVFFSPLSDEQLLRFDRYPFSPYSSLQPWKQCGECQLFLMQKQQHLCEISISQHSFCGFCVRGDSPCVSTNCFGVQCSMRNVAMMQTGNVYTWKQLMMPSEPLLGERSSGMDLDLCSSTRRLQVSLWCALASEL